MITFTNLKNNKFEELDSLLNKDFINNNGLDILYGLLVNHLISYYYSSEKDEYLKIIENFKNEFAKISNNLGLSQLSLTLLNKILNIDELIKEFNRKQKNNEKFSQEQFEIMCYSLRFILQSAQSKNNNFYNNLLTPQCKEYISNNFIPVTLPYNNIVINSYYILNELKKNIKKNWQ